MSGSGDDTDVRLADASSILVLAPSLDDADDEACVDLLTAVDPTEANVLSVTTSASPEDRLELWRSEVGESLPHRTTVVDARRDGSADSDATSPSITVDALPPDAEPVDIGAAVSRHLGAWESTPETTLVCLHSVTTLLDAFDRDRVVSLVNALNESCAAVDAVAHHHLDLSAQDEGTAAAFRPLYDAVIEHIPDHGWTAATADESKARPLFRSGGDAPGTRSSTSTGPVTVPLPYSFDTVLELIAAPRRRTLLYHLKDRSDGEIPVDRLVDRVAERERAIPKRDAPVSLASVRRSLVHNHLPKLETVGVVDFDPDEGIVRYHANPALEACLEYIETLELG